MRRAAPIAFALLVGGCGTLADTWVRRDFRGETRIAGFSEGTQTFLRPFLDPRVGEEGDGVPPAFSGVTMVAMSQVCRRPDQPAAQTPRARGRSLSVAGSVVASVALAAGEMALVEIDAQLDDATDRLISDLSSASAAFVNVPRLNPGFGSACFVATRTYRRSNAESGLLWEFGFVLRFLEGSRDAVVIEPLSFIFQRSAAATQDLGNVDFNISVTLQAPAQNDVMATRGSTEFRVRGVRPGGDSAIRQDLRAVRPQSGHAFVGPGSRFSVISIAATEMGVGASSAERERAFRARHQAAVTDLVRAIAADRLGVERLPGRD